MREVSAPRVIAPEPAAPAPVLVTGFEPFGGADRNPSWEIAQALAGSRIGQATVVAQRLPVSFARVLPVLRRSIETHRPQLIVCLGLAESRTVVSVERVAINLIDARIVDNDGAQPIDLPVDAHGPAAYFSTLPIKAMWAALLRAGVPAEVSQTAGTFVCNQVMYGALHLLHAEQDWAGVRAGFVHVPPLADEIGAPCHADRVLTGLRAALEVAMVTSNDDAVTAGAID